MKEFKTIKVETSAIQDLNIISAMTGEKQYEVVTRIADEARRKIIINNLNGNSKTKANVSKR